MNHFIRFLFFFSLAWLILSLFGVGQQPKTYTDDIVFLASESYDIGDTVSLNILNNTTENFSIPNTCGSHPLSTEKYSNGEWVTVSTEGMNTQNCDSDIVIAPGEQKAFSFGEKSYELFGQEGKYKIAVNFEDRTFAHDFDVVPAGFFSSIFTTIIYSPILNLLIWLVEVLPGHSLGWAIILMTIIIKTALLAPNHKALKSQRAMQKLQPELQKIKEKYKGDQARVAQETMALWKKHNVSPAGSCLPLLMQFPFLIAIFFILQSGLTANNTYLVYEILKPFDFSLINPDFYGMQLMAVGPWFLALAVGVAQYIQMKLSFASTQTPAGGDMMAQQMQMMQKMFVYVMPGMIAIFTLTMPAGVGLYWGISTLYAIGQQQVINKMSFGVSSVIEADAPKKSKKKSKKSSSKKKKADDAEDAVIVHKV